MSGPIVRKYGFPNFDKIFGSRDVQHGVDEPESGGDANRPDAGGTGLPPDLAHSPVDANRPESSGTMSPATEFGSTGQ